MAAPADLLALASGRLPPLTRLALGLGLGLSLALVLLFRPVHQSAPPLRLSAPSVLALPAGSPWVEQASLQEGSALFMSLRPRVATSIDAAQPDAAPFPAFGPELRSQPGQPLAIPASQEPGIGLNIETAFPIHEDRPFATIGQKPERAKPKARTLHLRVYSDLNEIVYVKDFRADDPLIKNHKSLSDSILHDISIAEFHLGVDAMGLQAPPYLVRSSGSAEWDQRVVEWARVLPWGQWLRPGSYRVVIGP